MENANSNGEHSASDAVRVRELVVLSGKGGCGKTSIAAGFAALSKGAVFADCDVDAADLMLVLRPQPQVREDFYSGELPQINPDECAGCGRCVQLCRYGALRKNGQGLYEVRETACEGCGVCADHCPANAIRMQPRLCGEWRISRTPFGSLVHARLGAGGENSGKLVTQVRQQAKALAETEKAELVIVDGPPGIGCPVIASLGGAWRVLVVSEPTLSGLHDLQRVLKLARHFEVPAWVCVNKSDINPGISRQIAQETQRQGAVFAGELPYDPEVTRAQRRGEPVVLSDSPAAAAVRKLWDKISAV